MWTEDVVNTELNSLQCCKCKTEFVKVPGNGHLTLGSWGTYALHTERKRRDGQLSVRGRKPVYCERQAVL